MARSGLGVSSKTPPHAKPQSTNVVRADEAAFGHCQFWMDPIASELSSSSGAAPPPQVYCTSKKTCTALQAGSTLLSAHFLPGDVSLLPKLLPDDDDYDNELNEELEPVERRPPTVITTASSLPKSGHLILERLRKLPCVS